MWRMSYEMANFHRSDAAGQSYLIERNPPEVAVNPRQQEWAEKAVRRYAAAQDKKWQRWNDAMFERKH